MFRFTEPSSGQISKHSIIAKHNGTAAIRILASQAQSLNLYKNITVLCFGIWPDDGSVN